MLLKKFLELAAAVRARDWALAFKLGLEIINLIVAQGETVVMDADLSAAIADCNAAFEAASVEASPAGAAAIGDGKWLGRFKLIWDLIKLFI